MHAWSCNSAKIHVALDGTNECCEVNSLACVAMSDNWKLAAGVSVSLAAAYGAYQYFSSHLSEEIPTGSVEGRDVSEDASVMRRDQSQYAAPLTPVHVYEILADTASTDEALQAVLAQALLHTAHAPLQEAYIKLGAFRKICELPLSSKNPRLSALALQVVANYASHGAWDLCVSASNRCELIGLQKGHTTI
jgi:hypothetical protein